MCSCVFAPLIFMKVGGGTAAPWVSSPLFFEKGQHGKLDFREKRGLDYHGKVRAERLTAGVLSDPKKISADFSLDAPLFGTIRR